MKIGHDNMLVYIIAIIAATGGLLFGFDTGVVSFSKKILELIII